MKRGLGMVLLGLLVLAGIIYGFIPAPVAVDSALAVRDSLRVTVSEEGRTRVKDRFIVSAPVAGYLRRIGLQVGDRVSHGAVLASLEPVRSEVLDARSRALAQARVAAAEASLSAATARA
ncbi:MAG: HlyD family secretion protein, partial [Gammaproteobacteria bacterium]|nr:HlyD family secretion protein [Gammaproteobacteria bacterium]